MNIVEHAPLSGSRFVAPSSEAIQNYAQLICDGLAKKISPDFAEPMVIDGLADFLRIASQIMIKQTDRLYVLSEDDQPSVA
jgi:hypothetical protein